MLRKSKIIESLNELEIDSKFDSGYQNLFIKLKNSS